LEDGYRKYPDFWSFGNSLFRKNRQKIMQNYEKIMQFRSICGVGKRFFAKEALFGRPSDKTIQIQWDFLDGAPTVGSCPPLWRTGKRGQLTDFYVTL
jgi:hypothetical protein